MRPLPEPRRGKTIDLLRPFVNVGSEDDWMLLVGWLIATFRNVGPYPALTLHGEQGSATSTTAYILRSLVDPNRAPLRAEPRNVQDLMIAANNAWILSFDNLSVVSSSLSDALCRLATGGGFGTRQLFADAEEIIFEAQRPLLLNGIEEVASRGDLIERSLFIYLPAIPETQRRPESEFRAEFEAARPFILGALLDAVVGALGSLPHVRLAKHPRMADFAVWGTAAEMALGWPAGSFAATYSAKLEASNGLALESSTVVPPLRELVAACAGVEWVGTATELHKDLGHRVDDTIKRQRTWPANGKALAGVLRRLSPNFRRVGITITFDERQGGTGKVALLQSLTCRG